MNTGAIFSEDRIYRYDLWRIWDDSREYLAVVGLNPSTADENNDDPTIRRCIGFAKKWGFGGLHMLNMFAFRATIPSDMKSSNEPIGKHNDFYLKTISEDSGMTLVAWGNHGIYLNRDKQVIEILTNRKDYRVNVHCLGITKTGQPKHPLYIPADTTPKHFENTGIVKRG